MRAGRTVTVGPRANPLAALVPVIDAIGTSDFDRQLFALLHEICGADHSASFRIGGDKVRSIGAASLDGTDTARRNSRLYAEDYWRRDPTLAEARRRTTGRGSTLIRLDPRELADRAFRDAIFTPAHICDRVLVCGAPAGALYGFTVLREELHPPFAAADLERLANYADVVLSVLAKHAALVGDPGWSAVPTLESVSEIEHRLGNVRTHLSAREVQVCARILFGMSTAEIAHDLAIKEESVSTYRKRSYVRLEVAGRHELLKLYLHLD